MSREQPETTSEVATVPGKGKTRNSFGNMVWTKHESKVLQGKLVERRSCTCRSPGRFGSFYLETCLSNRAWYCQLSLAKHELSGPVLQSSCLDRRCWRFLQRSLFCQGIASGCGGVRAMTSLLQQIEAEMFIILLTPADRNNPNRVKHTRPSWRTMAIKYLKHVFSEWSVQPRHSKFRDVSSFEAKGANSTSCEISGITLAFCVLWSMHCAWKPGWQSRQQQSQRVTNPSYFANFQFQPKLEGIQKGKRAFAEWPKT